MIVELGNCQGGDCSAKYKEKGDEFFRKYRKLDIRVLGKKHIYKKSFKLLFIKSHGDSARAKS